MARCTVPAKRWIRSWPLPVEARAAVEALSPVPSGVDDPVALPVVRPGFVV